MPTTRFLAALAVAGLLSTNALAQGDPKTHPGSLSIKPDVHLGKEIPAGPQRTAEFAAAQSVLDVLRADAALTSPIGYTVVVKRLASARLPGDAPGMPYHAAVLGALDYFGLEDNGRGGKEIGPTGGTVPFHVAINTFGDQGEIESTDEEADHGPRVLYDLKETGKFRGRPVYNGACTYVAHRPVPPLIPLTKERYYTLELIKARCRVVAPREPARHGDDDADTTMRCSNSCAIGRSARRRTGKRSTPSARWAETRRPSAR